MNQKTFTENEAMAEINALSISNLSDQRSVNADVLP